jgi:LysR family glycine cleavage system transcriptional activator
MGFVLSVVCGLQATIERKYLVGQIGMKEFPPLNALLFFEAVARLGSVKAAAAELNVTSGAVSRQIRLLEDYFGISLFSRQGRGLVVTSMGAAYCECVAAHLNGIQNASSLLRTSDERSVLRLWSYTTFATRWLIPRLSQFQLAYPTIDIRLTTASDWGEFDEFDAAIRLGDGCWPQVKAIRLVSNELIPVCSPKLLQEGAMTLERLVAQALLFVRARPEDWGIWCKAAGVPIEQFRQRLQLESSALACQAAQEGRGVALAQRVLVSEELRVGTLVAPFDVVVDRNEYTYYLVLNAKSQQEKALGLLSEWLVK